VPPCADASGRIATLVIASSFYLSRDPEASYRDKRNEAFPPGAIAGIEEFWLAVGGWPIRLNAEAHGDLVSRSSHLPHVVAAGLVNYVLSPLHPREQGIVCANGFRDSTRIASGSVEMWRGIALANSWNLGRVLGVFIEDLQEFQLALERGDARAIEEFFTHAKERRDGWQAHSPSASAE
jgi:prephenate dehydrogenase